MILRNRCEYHLYSFSPSKNAVFNFKVCGNEKYILPFPTLDISPNQKDWNIHATALHVTIPYDVPLTLKILILNNHQPFKYDLFFNVRNYPPSSSNYQHYTYIYVYMYILEVSTTAKKTTIQKMIPQ